ncbi:MAG: ATP-binding protein [Pirellulales bacterium]
MKRRYEAVISDHFENNRQMLFLMGPRQVGKTTTSRQSASSFSEHLYLNWDNQEHRELVLAGPAAVAGRIQVDRLRENAPLLILDEIHRYGRWKGFLKGLFDSYPENIKILVTGSARLDVFKAGGDSLMGRYFPYRMHPLSVAELTDPGIGEDPILRRPRRIDDDAFEALVRFGGFPEPFLRQELRFSNRWRRLRSQQLFKEDLRDLTRIHELDVVESLAEILRRRSGQLTSFSSLARSVNASVDSIRRWLATLESLYYCFAVRPWSRNIARALRKEPKYYLWDWSIVDDSGQRAENLVASALLKAVHFWTDQGLGEFGLYFVRDKQKHEVDFVVTREDRPWFLVEVKSSGTAALSPQLAYFQRQSGAVHAFQVALDLPFVDRDCFEVEKPVIVPARTFLAQMV